MPVSVSGLSVNVFALALGQNHSCALIATGTLKCWGQDYEGQLGDGKYGINTDQLTPIFVPAFTDSDGDGVFDDTDTFPLNAAAAVDTDSDGMPDDWLQPNQFGCTASTPTCNGLILDNDDDNDGVPDYIDAFPRNAAASLDTDHDGMTDYWLQPYSFGCNINQLTCAGLLLDNDDDNDGVPDYIDAFPLNAAAAVDTDGDGMPDDWLQPNLLGCTAGTPTCNGLILDNDADNDGVPDYIDADPHNAAINTERVLPLSGAYKGSSIRENVSI